MFDIDDMLEDGIDHNELWEALDTCETAVKGTKTGGGKAVFNMIRSALDELEMKEAVGHFDD